MWRNGHAALFLSMVGAQHAVPLRAPGHVTVIPAKAGIHVSCRGDRPVAPTTEPIPSSGPKPNANAICRGMPCACPSRATTRVAPTGHVTVIPAKAGIHMFRSPTQFVGAGLALPWQCRRVGLTKCNPPFTFRYQPPGPHSWGRIKNRGHPCPTPAGAHLLHLCYNVIPAKAGIHVSRPPTRFVGAGLALALHEGAVSSAPTLRNIIASSSTA